MNYHAGMLDQRVGLQSLALTPDDGGGATESWTTYATVWAHVRPMSGREREQADRVEATSNYMLAVRDRSDIKEGHRVSWGDRYLNIRFVRSTGGRHSFLELECELGAKS